MVSGASLNQHVLLNSFTVLWHKLHKYVMTHHARAFCWRAGSSLRRGQSQSHVRTYSPRGWYSQLRQSQSQSHVRTYFPRGWYSQLRQGQSQSEYDKISHVGGTRSCSLLCAPPDHCEDLLGRVVVLIALAGGTRWLKLKAGALATWRLGPHLASS